MTPTPGFARLLVSLIAASVPLAACVGTRGFDPAPVAGPVSDAGQRLGFSTDSLARGRDVYIGRCQRCHSLVPPQDRTADQWDRILPRMARKSRLDEPQAAAARAYILAAHAAATP